MTLYLNSPKHKVTQHKDLNITVPAENRVSSYLYCFLNSDPIVIIKKLSM